MKIFLILTSFLFLTLHQLNAQTNQRKDAADALNFIDSIPNPLKPSANNVAFYNLRLKSIANKAHNYRLPGSQIDSLKEYYKILTVAYTHAIKMANQNKTIDKFTGLKVKFLNLLTEGRSAWVKIIPVYIKMYTNGQTALSIREQNIINQASSIFMTSATKTLECAKILAIQEDEIEKKYQLELHGDLYK